MYDHPNTEGADEKLERDELLEVLRTQGFNADTREAIKGWVAGRVAEIEGIGNTDPEGYKRAGIVFNVESTLVYLVGGAQNIDDTLQELEEARYQAQQERFHDLVEKIDGCIEAVEGGELDVESLMAFFE